MLTQRSKLRTFWFLFSRPLRLIQVLYCEEKRSQSLLAIKVNHPRSFLFRSYISVFIKKMIISGFLDTSLTRTSFQIVDRCLTRKKKPPLSSKLKNYILFSSPFVFFRDFSLSVVVFIHISAFFSFCVSFDSLKHIFRYFPRHKSKRRKAGCTRFHWKTVCVFVMVDLQKLVARSP